MKTYRSHCAGAEIVSWGGAKTYPSSCGGIVLQKEQKCRRLQLVMPILNLSHPNAHSRWFCRGPATVAHRILPSFLGAHPITSSSLFQNLQGLPLVSRRKPIFLSTVAKTLRQLALAYFPAFLVGQSSSNRPGIFMLP